MYVPLLPIASWVASRVWAPSLVFTQPQVVNTANNWLTSNIKAVLGPLNSDTQLQFHQRTSTDEQWKNDLVQLKLDTDGPEAGNTRKCWKNKAMNFVNSVSQWLNSDIWNWTLAFARGFGCPHFGTSTHVRIRFQVRGCVWPGAGQSKMELQGRFSDSRHESTNLSGGRPSTVQDVVKLAAF